MIASGGASHAANGYHLVSSHRSILIQIDLVVLITPLAAEPLCEQIDIDVDQCAASRIEHAVAVVPLKPRTERDRLLPDKLGADLVDYRRAFLGRLGNGSGSHLLRIQRQAQISILAPQTDVHVLLQATEKLAQKS